jgi:hypothetical protein
VGELDIAIKFENFGPSTGNGALHPYRGLRSGALGTDDARMVAQEILPVSERGEKEEKNVAPLRSHDASRLLHERHVQVIQPTARKVHGFDLRSL